MNEKLHPFEAAGMGPGPYEFVGTFDLAEAMNPESAANFGNLRGALHDSPKLKAGMGTCACCGHGIMVICIVRDGAGDQWGVGSDCVMKTEEKALCDKAKIAVATRRKATSRKKADLKRATQRAAWLAGPSGDPEGPDGETRNEQLERRQRAMRAEQEAQEAKLAARRAEFGGVIDELTRIANEGNCNEFARAMRDALLAGPLTERQADCTAKFFFPRGSAPFHTLCERLTKQP